LFAFGYIDKQLAEYIVEKDTLSAILSTGIVWLLSILLMTFSRPIIRFLEGYGSANPFQIFLSGQRQQFKIKAQPHLKKLDSVLNARRRAGRETEKFEKLDVWQAARDFPEELDLVLPTRLGNVMRVYERYSDVVYGIEAIAVWPRLAMIIPEEARERIREAEALFYFLINMLSVGTFTLLTSFIMLIINISYHKFVSANIFSITPVLICIFFVLFSWCNLPDAARQRGNEVKSVFDLYRKSLAESLSFDLPPTELEERKMWEWISRRMLLRVSDDRLRGYDKHLDYFRKKNDGSENK
jgi:hypothetical protein